MTLAGKLDALGITPAMRRACRIPACAEAETLVDAGRDMFDRPQRMTPATHLAWTRMKAAAADDGIDLQLVSAFRSIAYQCEVIEKKLAEGRTIDDILKANAIPGHSEHHTGCALDLHSGDSAPLEEDFEDTPAFTWLERNAGQFGFHLSYPRDNPDGIAYEPWHWCFRDEDRG